MLPKNLKLSKMDTNVIRTQTPEADQNIGFDPFYSELERRILTLIADDDNEDCIGSTTNARRSTRVCINSKRSILEQQLERYFCWQQDLDNPTILVPVWLANLWRNTSNGTGVFIPRTIGTRRGYKQSRRFKGKGKN
ncbi:hypothetical protein R6Q59_006592 [Mikania micrantha]